MSISSTVQDQLSRSHHRRPGFPAAPPPQTSFTATPKQEELARVALSGQYSIIGFGGGIRGTKTWGSLMLLFMLARMFPSSRWAVVRRDLPVLRRNTIPSFNKLRNFARGFVGEINNSIWTATCSNGSEILFVPESIQSDPDLDRFKGLEVNGFLIEEANECQEVTFHKCIERAGSWIIPPRQDGTPAPQPHPLVLCTFNPSPNWVKRVFYDPWKMGTIEKPYYFLPATIADNPHVTTQYRDMLKNLPPEEYRRFVEGEWDVSDDPDQLILTEHILHAQGIPHEPGERRLGADIARFGDDLTILCLVDGNGLPSIKDHLFEYSKLSTDRSADVIATLCDQRGIDPERVHIDAVGLGAGTSDVLRRLGRRPTEIISGARPVPRRITGATGSMFRYANLRSQMWWEFRELLRTGKFSLPEVLHPKLLADLTAPRYTITGDKVITVESKSDIKQRLGRSTDYGDALVYAAFAPRRVRPVVFAPSYSQRNSS